MKVQDVITFVLCNGRKDKQHTTNKHFEILVSCPDKERSCMPAHETSCKLMELHAVVKSLVKLNNMFVVFFCGPDDSLQSPGPFITISLLLFLGAFFLFLIYMFGLCYLMSHCG